MKDRLEIEAVTTEQALTILTEIVDERGADYIYEKGTFPPTQFDPDGHVGCVYFNYTDKQPSCLIGHFLARFDATAEDLESCEGSDASSVVFDFGFNLDIALALSAAQDVQDREGTWGESLQAAIKRAEARA